MSPVPTRSPAPTGSTEADAPADRPSPVAEGYRAHLDGLRAVAVYLVLLFHAGIGKFSGGFIGVDVFFVLSGYLVTQLLMRDLRANGSIRLSRFYARRFRRLLPASLAVLLTTAVVYSAVASPAEMAEAVDAFRAALLYVANWFFIDRSSDYFAANIASNPVLHFWSLAVEEQFYLLAPLVLGGLFALTRRLRTKADLAMRLAVAGGGLASVVWALRLASTDLNRAYYGTDARAYQLLAGSLLALSPAIIRRASGSRVVGPSSVFLLGALMVAATSIVDANAIHRGVATTVITVLLIITIESARGGPVQGLLSTPSVVHLGKVSYGTYLWHWPVIVVAGQLADISPLSMFAIAALVATGLASLSHQILERPIRQQRALDRINPIVIATGLCLSGLAAFVVVPRVADAARSGTRPAAVASTAGFTPIPDLDFASARTDYGDLEGVALNLDCLDKPSAACTVVQGNGPHVLLIGDSHAQAMSPLFARLAQKQDLTLSIDATGGCPWQRNLYVADEGRAEVAQRTEKCIDLKRDLYDRVLPELKPDIVVAVSNDYLTRSPGVEHDENDEPIATNDPAELRSLIQADTERTLAALGDLTDVVVIVEPIPSTTLTNDPFVCLTESTVLEQCRFVANLDVTPIEKIYRDAADGDRVVSADVDRFVCPFLPICDPVIDGVIVRFDNQHITPRFALSIVDAVTDDLVNLGVLSAGP